MYKNNKYKLNQRFLISFLALFFLNLNPIPLAMAQNSHTIKNINTDDDSSDSDDNNDNSGSDSIPFSNSIINPKLSNIKQSGFITHNIVIYKKPDLNNIYFQTSLRTKLGEEAVVYTTELNKIVTSKEENINLNQDGQSAYSNNNFKSPSSSMKKEIKIRFLSNFQKIQNNDSPLILFNGKTNMLSNVNLEQEKSAYQITVYAEKESNDKNSNIHTIFNIASISAIDKKTQSANSNSSPSVLNNSKPQEKESNPKAESNISPENKDSHTTLDVKKSPTMSISQRSYETFGLNHKTSILSTDEFVIQDTTSLN
jgi:hypothetical protein